MANLSNLVSELSNLTVLGAAELAKELEEKWGGQRDPRIKAGRGTEIAKSPDEDADIELMQELIFRPRKIILQRFSKEETDKGKTPDFKAHQRIKATRLLRVEIAKGRLDFQVSRESHARRISRGDAALPPHRIISHGVTGNPWFKRGTLFRAAWEALRGALEPMTVRETTDAILAAKGITDATVKQHKDLQSGLRASLEGHTGSAKVCRNGGS